MSKVVLFGNGQMAEVAHVYLKHDSPHEVVAFCVDGQFLTETHYRGLPVVPFEEITRSHPPEAFSMFIPMSAKDVNRRRAEKYFQAKSKGYHLISHVSSKAIVLPESTIGENCFIFENNVIQPFVTIGNNVILWSGNHIGHHSSIGDHCFLTSHVVVSGRTTVGAYCYIGVNATLRDGITIGEGCVIGAGALIMKDAEARKIHMGLPAKSIQAPSDTANII
ncbi:MAG: acetyltransferase [Magnetococcales bacterium]|nr:acetyltransferase [Magnetococcales bacterium]